jgi:hypothetical protein
MIEAVARRMGQQALWDPQAVILAPSPALGYPLALLVLAGIETSPAPPQPGTYRAMAAWRPPPTPLVGL